MQMTVQEIAGLVGGTVHGDPSLVISGVNGIQEAVSGELTFVRTGRYMQYLETTGASAVLIESPPDQSAITCIAVAHPDLAFAQILQHFEIEQRDHPSGIHRTAVVSESATLGKNVALDAHVRIADDCVIGENVVIYPGVYIGKGSRIGANTILYPNVTIREYTEIGSRCILHSGACIGSDGFGFAPLGGVWAKIPQIGRVVIGDNVEIGSNTCVDRATFGVTSIGEGTKIDNLVQIGHNVKIGLHCAIAGKVGIAGSAIIGSHVQIGAVASIGGHLDIGDYVMIGALAGVTKSVPAKAVVSGFPARRHEEQRKIMVAESRMPEALRRLKQLERKIEALENAKDEQ